MSQTPVAQSTYEQMEGVYFRMEVKAYNITVTYHGNLDLPIEYHEAVVGLELLLRQRFYPSPIETEELVDEVEALQRLFEHYDYAMEKAYRAHAAKLAARAVRRARIFATGWDIHHRARSIVEEFTRRGVEVFWVYEDTHDLWLAAEFPPPSPKVGETAYYNAVYRQTRAVVAFEEILEQTPTPESLRALTVKYSNH